MKIGDELSVEAGELVAGGAALARVDGMPVFVAGLYPGDRARIRLVEVRKGFARGETVAIDQASPLRRELPCPVARDCGGCDWTELRLDAQLAAKERILRESLRRIGKIDPATLPPIALHPSPLNYRLRSRLHRDGDAIGFYAARSTRVVPLPRECEVVGPLTARTYGTDASAAVPPRATPDRAAQRAADDDDPYHAGPTRSASDVTLWETEDAIVTSGELTIAGYHVSTEAFFQVNRHLLGTMLARVSAIATATRGHENAVDLYSGVGFFSRPLASIFRRVTGVEGSRIAHQCARRNVPDNVKLVNAPVESWIPHMPRTDFVFLDPPRSGAKPEVIEAIGRKTAGTICFLACDPVTFARDAARLIASRWRLATLDLLDLFPNTHHVETLASFERAQ